MSYRGVFFVCVFFPLYHLLLVSTTFPVFTAAGFSKKWSIVPALAFDMARIRIESSFC